MKTRTDIGRSRWLREIEPVVRLAKKKPGFVARLTREMNKVSQGRQWHRQQIWALVNPDAEKRRQPLLGLGLVLIDAAHRVAAADAESRAKTRSPKKNESSSNEPVDGSE